MKIKWKRNIEEIFKVILTIFLILSIFGGAGYLKYKVWRLVHPDAPTWTFFIDK